jgi:hypothetical protein
VARRQAERYADRDAAIYAQREEAYQQQVAAQAPPPPPPPPAAEVADEDPMIAKLKDLAGLHDQGILTDEEFSTAKAKLLAG